MLSKYERALMLGFRLEQIARGAQPNVVVEPGMGVRDIVMREFEQRRIPFIIIRTLPNKTKEHYRLADMDVHPPPAETGPPAGGR